MTIQGQATPVATQQRSRQFPDVAYRQLGDTGLHVSQAGFGAYRIDLQSATHREALRHALQQGINLIDTSANYADGRSEALIGEVLGGLIERGHLAREEVVIVSKAGYVQGQNYDRARARQAEGYPFPDVVRYADGLDHCIHPEFLADQLERSLARLNLATLDAYLLHNPEYYLAWAARAGLPPDEARREYERRLALAFQYLETEVSRGRIRRYGMSSNTFPLPIGDPQHTSLAAAWKIAEAIRPQHHFRLIQLPGNLFETGLVTEANQPGGETTLAYAAGHGLGVLVNRPLNAIRDNALTRLADVLSPAYPASMDEVSTAVDTSVQIESRFQAEFLAQLDVDAATRRTLLEYLAVGIMLEGRWSGFGTYQNWRDVQTQFLVPRAQNAAQFLSNLENPPAKLSNWLQSYADSLNTTLAAVTAYYQAQAAAQSRTIKATAAAADPDWEADSLSQTAVRALRSTDGISCVLVGMRRLAYVDDVLAELAQPISQADRAESWAVLRRAFAGIAPPAG